MGDVPVTLDALGLRSYTSLIRCRAVGEAQRAAAATRSGSEIFAARRSVASGVRPQPTCPTPVRPLVAIGTPPAQSISRNFLVFASVGRVVRTLRVAVS